MASTSDPSHEIGAGGTHGGNVYYNRPRGTRSRREPAPRVDSAGDPAGRGPMENNPVRQAMLKNVRRFILISLAMMALLYLSMKGLFLVWQLKDSKVVSSTSSQPEDEVKSAPGLEVPTKPDREMGRIDTGSVREALSLVKRGKALALDGKYQDAIEQYREAVGAWPYLTDAWAELGSLYLKVNDAYRAQVALEKAVANAPASAETLNDLGVSYHLLGQQDKASKVFDRAIEAKPDFAAVYYNRALCHLSAGNRDAARDDFNHYLKLNPGDPRALREIAYLDMAASKYDDAMRSLEQAIVHAPDWPLLYFDAATAAAHMEQTDEVIRYLKQVESLSTPAAVYRLYQEPAFKKIRDSDSGRDFEIGLLARAKEKIETLREAKPVLDPAAPLSSASPAL